MRVILINPEPKHYTRARCAPLGVLSIGSYLQHKGHAVKILNRAIKKTDICKEFDDFKPDFVGCSITSIMPIDDAINVSVEAKKRGICVVWGGQYVTTNPDLFAELDCFDFLSLGEGEETWLELCESGRNKEIMCNIKGLAYKNEEGKMIRTEERDFTDLSILPPIDYDLIDIEKTFYTNYDYDDCVAVYLAKGCNGHCTFCYNHAFHKNVYRERRIDYLIQEAKYLKEKHGAKSIAFSDEFFGYTRENLHRICNTLIEQNLDMTWGCMTKIGIFTKEDFELMYKAGCRWIEFGIESGSIEHLRRMKKALTPERAEIDLKNCREAGIITLCYFMLGYIDETEEDLKATCQLLNRIPFVKFISSLFTPLPGSEAYDILVEQGKLKPITSLSEVMNDSIFNTMNANYSKVPTLDLKVIRASILWASFTKKTFSDDSVRKYSVFKKDVIDVLKSLRGHGFKEGVIQLYASATEFLTAFYYANFFPKIVKKYGLDLKERK